jgi:hypothetical protein
MSSPIPVELLAIFAEVSRLYPDMRFGQMLEMLALVSSDDMPQAPSSIQNERLLEAAVTHRLRRLKQLGLESRSLVQRPISEVRGRLLQVLQELHNQHPDMRIGQLVTNLAEQCSASLYDVEDEDLLAVAQQHLDSI